MNHIGAPVDFWSAIWRGWRGQCPRCGEGSLFCSYLKMQSNCPSCGLTLEPFRADDAPAYFTIFAVGHVVVPLVLAFERFGQEPPLWLHALLWLPLSVVMALLLLPRIKGAVIALLWTQSLSTPKPSTGGPSALS
ncbi:MAG: DUF983 domain-containing protein [Proteobacteria bacterium]|nr:DUF983 domain-containing protein [Pseudomonadota bacterium]MBS0549157.1 DUF983 domain-containing protein [Pseudomonadota bacterium]